MSTLSFFVRKPNLTFHLVEDFTVFPRGSIPFPMLSRISPSFHHLIYLTLFIFLKDFKFVDKDNSSYLPVLFVDEFWLFQEHLISINDSVSILPLTLQYSPISLMKWQMMEQMEQSFRMQQQIGTAVESESENFKVFFF